MRATVGPRQSRQALRGSLSAAEIGHGPGPVKPLPGDEPIPSDTARTLPGLFARRVELTPDRIAYRQFEGQAWRVLHLAGGGASGSRWRAGLAGEGLVPGDLVAMSLPNGLDWVCFDQAALGLGLVTVPLYATDSPGNLAHILADSGARLLLLDSDARWATAGGAAGSVAPAATGPVPGRRRGSGRPGGTPRGRLAALRRHARSPGR